MRSFLTDAAASPYDNDNLTGQFFLGRHALQFRFFQKPVFDVKRFLLG